MLQDFSIPLSPSPKRLVKEIENQPSNNLTWNQIWPVPYNLYCNLENKTTENVKVYQHLNVYITATIHQIDSSMKQFKYFWQLIKSLNN